jgi:hypothetical protein
MTYLCTSDAILPNFAPEQREILSMDTDFHVFATYRMPLTIPVKAFLVEGDNYIDFYSSNSGEGNCQLSLEIHLLFEHAGQ